MFYISHYLQNPIMHFPPSRLIIAPMAGGPSTPELVSAAAQIGAFGFLAAGYLSSQSLSDKMQAVHGAYGVNLFAPQTPAEDLSPLDDFARNLQRYADEYGITLNPRPQVDMKDDWDDKIALLHHAARAGFAPDVVSVTFGLMSKDDVRALQQAGMYVWSTVARVSDALSAAQTGVNALIVQSSDAGGHRATFRADDDGDMRPLSDLIKDIARELPSMPLIAAGGISTPDAVRDTLNLPNVKAVQCGTAFLSADEAGTGDFYRRRLLQGGETTVTRIFSGRPARSIATALTERITAPALYPYINAMMTPLKQAATAAGNPEPVSAWAGTGLAHIRTGGTADIAAYLLSKVKA